MTRKWSAGLWIVAVTALVLIAAACAAPAAPAPTSAPAKAAEPTKAAAPAPTSAPVAPAPTAAPAKVAFPEKGKAINCTFCGQCVKECPTGCLTYKEEKEKGLSIDERARLVKQVLFEES